MRSRRENRLVDSITTPVYSSAYTVHAFPLPFSFHPIAEVSHTSDDRMILKMEDALAHIFSMAKQPHPEAFLMLM